MRSRRSILAHCPFVSADHEKIVMFWYAAVPSSQPCRDKQQRTPSRVRDDAIDHRACEQSACLTRVFKPWMDGEYNLKAIFSKAARRPLTW